MSVGVGPSEVLDPSPEAVLWSGRRALRTDSRGLSAVRKGSGRARRTEVG